MLQLKILNNAIETWQSQISKYFLSKTKIEVLRIYTKHDMFSKKQV